MEEDTLEQKQQYLRENILEKGYDPNKFSEFLTMKMGETGMDLENWPFNELCEATNEFIRIEKENEQKKVNENNVEKEEEIMEEKEINKIELNGDNQNEEKANKIIEEKPNEILIQEKKEEKEKEKEKEKEILLKENKEEKEEKINEIIIEEKKEEKVNKKNENLNQINQIIIDEKQENKVQEQSVKCLLIDETPISKEKEIEIIVSDPKVEKNGFFLSYSYSTYLICTSPLNLQVRRQFSDILWLYDYLKSRFVNCVVPPLFKRKDSVDNDKMNERVYYIDKFLNGICQHPILKNSKIFYSFLSTKNTKEFIKIKTQYEKIQAPSEIQHLKSLKGELNIVISAKNENYFENIKSKLNSQETLYNDLFSHYKNLLNNFSLVSKEMNEISNIWKKLYNLQCSKMESDIFKFHSQIMDGWNEFQKSNITLLESMDKYFKFINEEYNNFKDLAKVVDNNKYNFNKSKQKQQKTQIFPMNKNKDGDIDEELKIRREENKVKKFKNEYGCYLNIYIDEYERICNLNNTRLKKNIAEIIKDLNDKLSKCVYKLSEVLSSIDTCN